jgi:hypothetical protein
VIGVLCTATAAARLQDVLWFNMREEPVVYVNGLPFVLREQRRPLKNLQVRRMLHVHAAACAGVAL